MYKQRYLVCGVCSIVMTLALTPLEWNSWNHFGCNINESIIKREIDAMVSSGMKTAGYQYINIDD